jgi:hypothetical protein
MSWTLQDGTLRWTGAVAVAIPCPSNTVAAGEWHDLVPGLCRFRLTGGAALSVRAVEGGYELSAIGAGQFEWVLCPLVPLVGGEQSERLVCWPLITQAAEPVAGWVLSAELTAGFTLKLHDQDLLKCLEALGDKLKWRLGESVTELFRRNLLRLPGPPQGFGSVRLAASTPVLREGKLVIEDLKLTLDPADATQATVALHLSRLSVRLQDFRLELEDGAFSAQLQNDAYLLGGKDSLLTLLFHRGTRFRFFPALANPRMEAVPPSGRAAMTAFIPGGSPEDLGRLHEAGTAPDRFVLDFKANAAGRLNLGSNGLTGKAEARPLPIQIGSEGARLEGAVTQGEVTFQEGRYDASVTATAKLPYFQGSDGSLTIRASSEGRFSARWEMSPGQAWKDPTGHIEVHEPRASVTIQRKEGVWSVAGKVGGRLELVKTPRFVGDAGRWLGAFAKGLRLEFDNLSLSQLGMPDFRVQLDPVNLPRGLDLWGLFKLDLKRFHLLNDGFSFGGDVGFDISGLSFSGGFPSLRCRLSRATGLSISTDPGDGMSISGQLSTPGGVKATLSLRRQSGDSVEELVGNGTVSIPGLPGITVLCMLGRRLRGKAVDPLFLIYAEADLPVPLFPGVVLREVGLGFGINKVLGAIQQVPPEKVVSQLMSGPLGLPDAADPASWATSTSDFDLSLVAQTAIAPSTHGEGPFPYLGRAMLYARPTTDFVIMLGANLWLMTRLDDSRKPDFKARPAMKGALVLFPRHGFLEMQARTERSPRTSVPIPLLDQAFSVASGEFYLKASRDTFLFRAGPMRTGMDIAGVQLQGQVVYAVYVGSRGAITVMQASLEGSASVDWDVTLRFGPLSVTAGMRLTLAMAFEAVLAGMYLPAISSPALYARVRVYVQIELTARLTIGFRLVIKIWRFRKTISWSKSFSATLQLSVDMRIELVLSTEPAFHGVARVEVRLFGYSFSPQITLGHANRHLQVARDSIANLLTSTSPS